MRDAPRVLGCGTIVCSTAHSVQYALFLLLTSQMDRNGCSVRGAGLLQLESITRRLELRCFFVFKFHPLATVGGGKMSGVRVGR